MRIAILAGAAVFCAALGACSIERAQEASDAKAAMIGMTKEQILGCMGPAASTASAGGTEVWSYNSGNGRTTTVGSAYAYGGPGWAGATGTASTQARFCRVDIVMANDRVTRVNYSGPTGGLLTKGEQCAFAVENCMSR